MSDIEVDPDGRELPADAAGVLCDPSGPVCLTRSAPAKEYSGSLMLYDVVDRSVVARSSVLQCIIDAGGDTLLPDNIALVEFNIWRRAGDASTAAVQAMDIRTVCTIVKVADALDDLQASSWLMLLTQHLVRLGASRDPVPPGLLADVSDGLHKLPPRLRSQTFAAAAQHACGVHFLLNLVPPEMHSAVVATNISAQKALVTRVCPASTAYLRALTSLPAYPPSLLALTVTVLPAVSTAIAAEAEADTGRPPSEAPRAVGRPPSPPHHGRGDRSDGTPSLSTGSPAPNMSEFAPPTLQLPLLCDVLRHHTALEELALAVSTDFGPPDSRTYTGGPPTRNATAILLAEHSQQLAPAVAALASLRALTLGSPQHRWPSSTLRLWRTTLSHGCTPHLASLTLHLADAIDVAHGIHAHAAPPLPYHAPKSALRETLASASAPPPSPACLATMLSAATALTSLDVHMHAHMHALAEAQPPGSPGSGNVDTAPGPPPTLTATAPLPLPHLRTLTLTGRWLALAGPLLHHLSAPLTALSLGRLRPAFITSRATDPDPCHLFLSLAKFTLLQRLQFDIPMCVRVPATAEWWGWLVTHAEQALAELTQLEELHITADVRALLRLVPAALAAAPRLARLRVSCRVSANAAVPSRPEWTAFLADLRAPRLQELRLWMPGVPCDHIPGIGSLLHSLSALTCIKLTAYDNCLTSAADVAAVASLTALQHLAVHEFTVPRKLQAELGRALCTLGALTQLSLTGAALGRRFADAVADAGAPWPLLRHARLGLRANADGEIGPGPAEALVRAMPRMHDAHACELTLCGEHAEESDGEGYTDQSPGVGVPMRDPLDNNEGPTEGSLPGGSLEDLAASLGVSLVCEASPELEALSQ